jgi:hypothetical protein
MEPDNISQKLQGFLSRAERINWDPVFTEIPSEPRVPSEGGVVFKLHYFQVDTAGAHGAFGVLTWGFLSNFHKQNKSDTGNGTIRTCYHQSQIFDDLPHSARLGVSLSKLNTCARTAAGGAVSDQPQPSLASLTGLAGTPAGKRVPQPFHGGLCSEVPSHPIAKTRGLRATRDKR